MLMVPLGAIIQPWHYWFTPELSMTEAERTYYHGHPCSGNPLSTIGHGKLFEIRIPNAALSGGDRERHDESPQKQ